MSDLEKQLAGYRLITAEILYHLPDYQDLLQAFVWQDYDLAPRYPVLNRFLGFWETHIEGRLHSVTVAQTQLIQPARLQVAKAQLYLH
jgi:uncharacterized protein Usg